MAATVLAGPILVADATSYFGFGTDSGGTASTGARIITGTGVPAVSAPKGSLFLRSDGAGQTYGNTDGATTWAAL